MQKQSASLNISTTYHSPSKTSTLPHDTTSLLLPTPILPSLTTIHKNNIFAQSIWDTEDSDIQEVANGNSVKSASSVAGASITQSASVVRGAPGAGFTANATVDVGEPGSPETSFEGGVKTTLSGDKPREGNRASATGSAVSHSSSAAAAPAVVEQSSHGVVVLALCGSIMLVAAMLF